MSIVAIGLRAQKGSAVVVAVALAAEPRLLLSELLPTHVPGDRAALEPYRVASEMAQAGQRDAAAAVVDAARARQAELAATGLRDIVARLTASAGAPGGAALLVNRAGWITDLLDYGLGWAEHVPVAEGLAVRDALRIAITDNRMTAVEVDEKSLTDSAVERLGVSAAAIDGQLKAMGADAGRPWRREQKLAALAAWLAAAALR